MTLLFVEFYYRREFHNIEQEKGYRDILQQQFAE